MNPLFLPPPTRAARNCSLNTTKSRNTIPTRTKSPTKKSCSRPMCRRSMQTAILYGTLPKRRKNNAYEKQHCTQHRVEFDTLYSLVLNKIRECAAAALTDSEAVAGRLTDTCQAEQKDQREAMERTLAKDGERIEVLEKMVLRFYEDMAARNSF